MEWLRRFIRGSYLKAWNFGKALTAFLKSVSLFLSLNRLFLMAASKAASFF